MAGVVWVIDYVNCLLKAGPPVDLFDDGEFNTHDGQGSVFLLSAAFGPGLLCQA